MENLYLIKKQKPPVISIVSTKSNTGKTTLIEGLIKIFKDRNYSVGVLKHDAHKFDIDKEGKDSYRFSMAGAENVIISSSEKVAMIQKIEKEKEIGELIYLFKDMDIVLTEGFKKNNYPKIEVHRKEVDDKMLYQDLQVDKDSFIAIASNELLNIKIPVLDLNNINLIADFIENKFLKGNQYD
jgi:molybdopterin-guanine dinucleotide biosynthesis protein B